MEASEAAPAFEENNFERVQDGAPSHVADLLVFVKNSLAEDPLVSLENMHEGVVKALLSED